MTLKHPFQDQRVRVIAGQYEGRTGRVVCVRLDHGEHGFCEIEFDQPPSANPTKRKLKKALENDLVPCHYIDRAGVI
ncbi:KOW motif-containing protein [Paraburkholderia sp. J11-2]|uniref:KOW motif-containing protein n=1 Tax=Paraburkholderia sp. J11-2 TaxID=2805431 RepID=UPI002AB7CFC1|nr:KOW motif-containing protein [Paraburkholderia sp. J11-2]